MQTATLPPWLSPWPPEILYGPRKYKTLEYYRAAIARERARQRSRLTIYTYGSDDSQLLRIGGWSGDNTARPAGWERYPLEPYAPLDPAPDLARMPGRVNVEWVSPTESTAGGRSAIHAWLFGAALVAVLVVLVRAIEKCLDSRLHKSRRQSQEWSTPNVRATSQQSIDNGTIIIPGLENAEPLPADLSDTISIDLPPPYSECTHLNQVAIPTTSFADKLATDISHEEPPPPYSDCYVEFSNKNGIPSVLIFSRKRTTPVNRSDIVDTETTINENNVTEQNVANTEVDGRHNDASVDSETVSDATNLTSINNVEDGIPGTSTDEATDDNSDPKERDVLV